MRPPDQIPNLEIGKMYYLKRRSVYRSCRLISLRSPDDFTRTAKVRYFSDGELLICRQSELLTDEQYRAVLTQRRKEAYERDAPKRLMEARTKYGEVIAHWKTGRRTAQAMYESSKTGTVRGWGQMIAAAKRWKLIEPDKDQA
jgi:hypothetical protein